MGIGGPMFVFATRINTTVEAVLKHSCALGRGIGMLPNPTPPERPLFAWKKQATTKTKTTKKKKPSENTSIQKHTCTDSGVGELASAWSALTFGQLLPSDAHGTGEELQSLIPFHEPLVFHMRIFKENPSVITQNKDRQLTVALVKIYGKDAKAMLNTIAVPNLISLRLGWLSNSCWCSSPLKWAICSPPARTHDVSAESRNSPLLLDSYKLYPFCPHQGRPLGLDNWRTYPQVASCEHWSGLWVCGKNRVCVCLEHNHGQNLKQNGWSENEFFTTDPSRNEIHEKCEHNSEANSNEQYVLNLAKEL